MKDYANKNNLTKRTYKKSKKVFRSGKPGVKTISFQSIVLILMTSFFLFTASAIIFKTNISSSNPQDIKNNIEINFPESLLENSVLIEVDKFNVEEKCEYFVQIGSYGNKKYADEAVRILDNVNMMRIENVTSSLYPGKILHSVISGPYNNRSSANNAKERITIKGFDPRLRILCRKK